MPVHRVQRNRIIPDTIHYSRYCAPIFLKGVGTILPHRHTCKGSLWEENLKIQKRYALLQHESRKHEISEGKKFNFEICFFVVLGFSFNCIEEGLVVVSRDSALYWYQVLVLLRHVCRSFFKRRLELIFVLRACGCC